MSSRPKVISQNQQTSGTHSHQHGPHQFHARNKHRRRHHQCRHHENEVLSAPASPSLEFSHSFSDVSDFGSETFEEPSLDLVTEWSVKSEIPNCFVSASDRQQFLVFIGSNEIELNTSAFKEWLVQNLSTNYNGHSLVGPCHVAYFKVKRMPIAFTYLSRIKSIGIPPGATKPLDVYISSPPHPLLSNNPFIHEKKPSTPQTVQPISGTIASPSIPLQLTTDEQEIIYSFEKLANIERSTPPIRKSAYSPQGQTYPSLPVYSQRSNSVPLSSSSPSVSPYSNPNNSYHSPHIPNIIHPTHQPLMMPVPTPPKVSIPANAGNLPIYLLNLPQVPPQPPIQSPIDHYRSQVPPQPSTQAPQPPTQPPQTYYIPAQPPFQPSQPAQTHYIPPPPSTQSMIQSQYRGSNNSNTQISAWQRMAGQYIPGDSSDEDDQIDIESNDEEDDDSETYYEYPPLELNFMTPKEYALYKASLNESVQVMPVVKEPEPPIPDFLLKIEQEESTEQYIISSVIAKTDKECLICFETFEIGDRQMTMGCFCMFHESCIKKWFNKQNKVICPTHKEFQNYI